MKYCCDNCGFTADEDEFKRASKLSQRLAPGGKFTDLECPDPDCGCLAFPVDDDDFPDSVQELRRRGYSVLIWTPEELEGASPTKVADRLCELGWDVISDLKPEEVAGANP